MTNTVASSSETFTLELTLGPAIRSALASLEARVPLDTRLDTSDWRAIGSAETHEDRIRERITAFRADAKNAPAEMAAMLLSEVARLCEHDLKDPRTATKTILEALRTDPTSHEAQRTTMRLLRKTGKHQILAQLVDDLANQITSSSDREALLFAHVLDSELVAGQAGRAAQVYERLLREEPDSPEAAEGVLRLAIRDKDWPHLAAICRQLADHEDLPQMRTTLLLAAALLDKDSPLEDRAGWLARAAADSTSELALPLAVGFYRASQDVDGALRAIQSAAELRPEDSAHLHFQASWILAREDGRMEEAIAAAERASDLDPQNLLFISWLGELYEREARWPDLARTLEKKVKIDTGTGEAVETLATLAEVLAGHLNRRDDAIKALERALHIAPTDLPCLQSLGQLYGLERRWTDLVEMHIREASVTKESQRSALALYRAAQILAHRLERQDEAIAHLEKALDLAPTLSAAVRLAEDLYHQAERFEDLVTLYGDQLQRTSEDSSRVGLLERIGAIVDARLYDVPRAIATYEQLLELEPTNPVALRALDRLYTSAGQHSKLLSILRAQAMYSPNPMDKASLLLRMGQILEEDLGHQDQALAHYREAIETHPTSEAYQLLGRFLHATQRWAELLELTESQLGRTNSVEDKIALLFRIGRLHEQYLEDQESAATSYRRALEIDAGYLPALRGIARVAHHVPDWRRLGLESMLLPAETRDDDGQRAVGEVRLALSLIQEQPAATKELLQRVVASRADDRVAQHILVEMLTEEEAWPEIGKHANGVEAIAIALGGQEAPERALEIATKLAVEASESPRAIALRWQELLQTATGDPKSALAVLEKRTASETNPRLRTGLRMRMATLLQADAPKAKELCEQVLADNPGDVRAIEILGSIAMEQDDKPLQLMVLEKRLELTAETKNKTPLLVRRASVHLDMDNREAAVADLRQALEMDNQCRPAYESLIALYGEDDDREGLRWTLEIGAETAIDPLVKVRDLLRRSDLRAEQDDKDGSLADLDRILAISPDQPNALKRVEASLRERGDFEQLATRLIAARDASSTPSAQAAINIKLAQIYREQLDDPHRAAALLATAIEKDPDCVAALLLAADVQTAIEQPTEAISLLNRAILRSENEKDLIGAHLATAHLFHSILGVSDRALRNLRTALKLDPHQTTALAMLADIAHEAGNYAEAEEHLVHWKELASTDAEKSAALTKLARTRSMMYGESDERTCETAIEAASLAPEDLTVVQLAVDSLRSAQRWAELDGLLEESIPRLPEDQRISLLLVRGKALAQHLGRRDEARELMRQAVAAEPDKQDALELLVSLLDEADASDPELRDEAILLHRRLLEKKPMTLSSLRQLGKLCTEAGRVDEAFCAGSALVFINKASEEEVYFHKQRRRKLPAKLEGSLEQVDLDKLLLSQGPHPVGDFLAALKPTFSEFAATDLSVYGLNSFEDAALPEDHPTWSLARECGNVLGVSDFRMVEALGGASEGTTEPGSPTTLVLPRDFQRYPVPQQRFLLGTMLARIATDTEACDPRRPEPLSPRSLAMLTAATIRTKEPDFGNEIASPAILDDMAQQLRRSTDDAVLEKLREFARACCEPAHLESTAAWLEGCDVACYRAGLLCGGSLDSVTAYAARSQTTMPSTVVHELVRFVTSSFFATLRSKIGAALQK